LINVSDKSAVNRVLACLFLVLSLAPSAVFLWRHSDLPSFGDLHDDALYYVSAKSLADGGAYRVESLPGEPSQTKYPPLYPLLLSIAWHIDSQFPHNLPIAAWISWLAFPAILIQLPWVFPRLGITGWPAWLLMTLVALNPYMLVFSSTLVSELAFTALILAAILLTERVVDQDSPAASALAAGTVAGLAYLTRSAGIVFLIAGPLYLWMRHKRREAALWAVAMLPFVVSWTIWTRLHQVSTSDPALIYYTDYFRYELYSLSLRDLPLFLWRNIDGLLFGLGSLVLPDVVSSFFFKTVAEVTAIAMIAGVVRMVRRGQALLYALLAAGSCAQLIVWHFPPNERFVLPLFPLALAGLMTEMEHLYSMLRAGLRHRDTGQRVVAAGMLLTVASIMIGAVAIQVYVGQVLLPEQEIAHRAGNAERLAAYDWIRATLPPDALLLSSEDALVFLHTGRHAMRRTLPPPYWYREDHAKIIDWMSNFRAFPAEHGLNYLAFTGVDFRQGITSDDRDAIEKAIRSSPDLSPLYQTETAAVYRFR
jgi:4-amino-4-deoxy-L-arabinose transferase-like glycosyltransferase